MAPFQCSNCGFMLEKRAHRLLRFPVDCPRCRKRETFGPGTVPVEVPQREAAKVFDAMEAQQRETSPALAAALDRHAQSVQQVAQQVASDVRRVIAKFMDDSSRRPAHLYLGERQYRALRTYCDNPDPETSGRLTEFEGVPVLGVRAESHIGVS